MSELRFDFALRRPGFRVRMDGAIPLEGVTAIMGPSGSGKTTLLRTLAGLEPRAEGTVLFGSRVWMDAASHMPARDRRVGFVFQEGRLFRHMTVAENIAYGARRRGVSPAVMHGIAEAVGVRGLLHRRPGTLSGGEVRRVALARAMAAGPDILFMDEPLAGLDDEAKSEVLPYIARAVTVSGAPVVYVSHSEAEVTQLADRVLRVSGGEIEGWMPPPPTLAVTVLGSKDGRALLELGGARFELPGVGERWDARRIAIPPRGYLLSRQSPGLSGGFATLSAVVARATETSAGVEIVLRVEGQTMTVLEDRGGAFARRVPAPDETLWLTLVDAHLR